MTWADKGLDALDDEHFEREIELEAEPHVSIDPPPRYGRERFYEDVNLGCLIGARSCIFWMLLFSLFAIWGDVAFWGRMLASAAVFFAAFSIGGVLVYNARGRS